MLPREIVFIREIHDQKSVPEVNRRQYGRGADRTQFSDLQSINDGGSPAVVMI